MGDCSSRRKFFENRIDKQIDMIFQEKLKEKVIEKRQLSKINRSQASDKKILEKKQGKKRTIKLERAYGECLGTGS